MPRPYSEDLRWRAIWMKEFLRYSVDEVAAALYMSPKTILRYVSKCLNSGEVKAETLGRPLNSFLMHPHVEFVIMEAVLDHPEKTLSEIAQNIYEQTGSECALSSILLYLERNRFSRKRVWQIFLSSATFWFFPAYVNLRKKTYLFIIIFCNHSF